MRPTGATVFISPDFWGRSMETVKKSTSVYNVTYGVVLRILLTLILYGLKHHLGSERAKLWFRKGQTLVPKGPLFSTGKCGS